MPTYLKQEILHAIRETAFIPIVRVSSHALAHCAAKGIVKAGFPLIEITLTISNALQLIEELVALYGDRLMIGAGTVLDVESCRSAISAGASFIVSPATDLEVIATARKADLVTMPGAQTATEVVTGWRAGADMIKIFPAGMLGGPRYIRALKEPLPHIELVPSNGVDAENAAEYLAAGATAVGIGSLVFSREALESDDVETVALNARAFAQSLRRDPKRLGAK